MCASRHGYVGKNHTALRSCGPGTSRAGQACAAVTKPREKLHLHLLMVVHAYTDICPIRVPEILRLYCSKVHCRILQENEISEIRKSLDSGIPLLQPCIICQILASWYPIFFFFCLPIRNLGHAYFTSNDLVVGLTGASCFSVAAWVLRLALLNSPFMSENPAAVLTTTKSPPDAPDDISCPVSKIGAKPPSGC